MISEVCQNFRFVFLKLISVSLDPIFLKSEQRKQEKKLYLLNKIQSSLISSFDVSKCSVSSWNSLVEHYICKQEASSSTTPFQDVSGSARELINPVSFCCPCG